MTTGRNNPVGVAWIGLDAGLDKTGYGIHGTPAPEQVGRTESHGCFRLANWDAEYLVKLVWIGMPVLVEPKAHFCCPHFQWKKVARPFATDSG